MGTIFIHKYQATNQPSCETDGQIDRQPRVTHLFDPTKCPATHRRTHTPAARVQYFRTNINVLMLNAKCLIMENMILHKKIGRRKKTKQDLCGKFFGMFGGEG